MNIQTETTISHLTRAYTNVQEVLRFMDAKAGVIFTLAGIMIGTVVAGKPSEWCDWARLSVGAGVTCSCIAMFCALRVVWPSHGPRKPDQLTLLFPALHPDARNESGSKPDILSLIRLKVQTTLSSDIVVNEYVIQLAHLHTPIVRKIRALRGAIIFISIALLCLAPAQLGRKGGVEPVPPIHVNVNLTSETLQKAIPEFHREGHEEKKSRSGHGIAQPVDK